jgi:anti-anti-sigma factor
MAVVSPPAGVDDRFGRVAPRIEVLVDRSRTPGPATVVELHGEHGIATSEAVRVALSPLRGRVVVDLSSCALIDSTIIGILLEKAAALTRDGQVLELRVAADSIVARALTIAGAERFVAVRDASEPQASR